MININELLAKHLKTTIFPKPLHPLQEERIKYAFREYTQLLLQEAADKAKMSVQPSEMEEWEVVPDQITRKDIDDKESGCEDFWIKINKESITSIINDINFD